jgi:IS4 transposase
MARKPWRVSYRRELVEAIETVFPAQWFSQFPSHGNSVWTPQKVFWVSLVMSWLPTATLHEQFEAACDVIRQVHPRWPLGTSLSGFLAARQRLRDELRRPLVRRLRSLVTAYFQRWRVRGWLLFGVDGSRFETPRTRSNEAGLGCAGKESTTPQVFQTTLQHIGTGLVWDFRLGRGTDSERRHLDDMLAELPPQSMLTADAGFISFDLCTWLHEHQHPFVLRVGGNARLLQGLDSPDWEVEQQLVGRLVYLWPQKKQHLPPVVLRLIVVHDEHRQPIYLVTNILDEEQLSDTDAAEIYRLRWQLELYYRFVKQTFDHQRLHSRTPAMSLAEQAWTVVGLWVLQLISVEQLLAAKKLPASWSAAKARDAARRLLRRALTADSCVRARTFRRQLQAATVDDYRRGGPKQIRDWPRKKQAAPPGPPKIQPATAAQRQRAQRLRNRQLTRF